jgi:hypothetical protein
MGGDKMEGPPLAAAGTISMQMLCEKVEREQRAKPAARA